MPPASPTLSTRRALPRLAIGITCALGVGTLGLVLERATLGGSDAAAVERVEREVRSEFGRMTGSLGELARAVASNADFFVVAPGDPEATRALFTRAAGTLRERAEPNLAVTAYGPTGSPIAWSGRPSDIPSDRIAGPAALFVAPGPLGLRLVYLEPVVERRPEGVRRLGAVAAERALSAPRGVRNPLADTFLLPTSIVPVSIRTRFEGAGEATDPFTFVIAAESAEPLLEVRVPRAGLARARDGWRRSTAAAVVAVLGLTLLLLAAPLLERRARARRAADYAPASLGVAAVVVGAATLLWWAARTAPLDAPLFSPEIYASDAIALLGSPAHFLIAALVCAAIVALIAGAAERRKAALRTRRRWVGDGWAQPVAFALAQATGASAAFLALLAHQWLVRNTLANTSLDVLHSSVHPWSTARLAMGFGLILFHAVTIWMAALALGLPLQSWRLRPRSARQAAGVFALWLATFVVWLALSPTRADPRPGPTALAFATAAVLAYATPLALPRYRHGSQAFRLLLMLLALLIPTLALYPTMLHDAERARRDLIEAQFAPQVMSQRRELQGHLRQALEQIDRLPGLGDLVASAEPVAGEPPPTDRAFLIWAQTDLARFRLTSAIELYGPGGLLASRFALNLPEYTSSSQRWQESGCQWDLFEEVSPFGAEERRLLHAGRGVCAPSPGGGQPATTGALVVHVMLDYNNLPFISSQSPYVELFRSTEPPQREGVAGRDVEFVVYGWSRMPIYQSGAVVWPLDEPLFSRVYASRQPFWARVGAGNGQYDVHFLNDRGGIYALGYPVIAPLGHMINLAELATLVGVLYGLMLIATTVYAAAAGRRAASGRALLREIRASFYRKLFLAFVLASVVPVLTLAVVTGAYSAARLRSDVESEAVKTAATARRVVEDLASVQQRGTGSPPAVDDDLLVWISRVIEQDVNVFDGPRLIATSERNLFASGLLPTRTPGDVYRAIALERRPYYVAEEEAGDFRYLVVAAPVRTADRDAILTVPLTLRQQEIERGIDELNRRVLLAALIFILLGAGIGYSMAERIADPVRRLTRATRRIARGDLDARIAATSSDELRRLVEAFNGMAAELQRQQVQLERTHRLEAWAEMARQVAHEIKNPLTPIQLSAEHLRRVHGDRGRPLGAVLDGCLDTIMAQVRLLRQIAAEFSSFASSPSARPSPVAIDELVREVVEPYRAGLEPRIAIAIDLSPDLPILRLDRTLVARALTNVIENALHAMPGDGALTIGARPDPERRAVRVTIADTGLGMDPESLRRIFEPYFSTKAIGTGLGLTIAKRNVELNGGTIAVESGKGTGTTVTIVLPVSAP